MEHVAIHVQQQHGEWRREIVFSKEYINQLLHSPTASFILPSEHITEIETPKSILLVESSKTTNGAVAQDDSLRRGSVLAASHGMPNRIGPITYSEFLIHEQFEKGSIEEDRVDEIFMQAVRQKDFAVIQTIRRSFPTFHLKTSISKGLDMLLQCISLKDIELFRYLIISRIITKNSLEKCLTKAVLLGYESVVATILELTPCAFEYKSYAKPFHFDIPGKSHSSLKRFVSSPSLLQIVPNAESLFIMAIDLGDLDVIDIILQRDLVDIKKFSDPSWYSFPQPQLNPISKVSLLHWAILAESVRSHERRGLPILTRFLEAGADPNSITNCIAGYNYSALLEAITFRSNEVVELLITKGADVNRPATFGIQRSPLQLAAELDAVDIVQILLQNGAIVTGNPSFSHKETALELAMSQRHYRAAKVLLQHGAQLEQSSPYSHDVFLAENDWTGILNLY